MKMLLIALRAIRELEARFRCDWPAGHVCRGLGEGLLGSSVANSCQRKVEMSGFLPDRNVRFHGLLQGWFAGAWYLGLILFLGLGVCAASPGGRRPEGLADGRSGSGQARRCR